MLWPMANSNRGGGSFCSAINCQNTRKKGWRLFSFPKDEERCKIWVEKSRRQDLVGKPVSYLRANCCLCAAHFEPSQFMNPENPNCRLIWSAVPSIFDFNNNNTSPKAKRKRKVSGTVDASTCEFNDKGDDEAGESTDITTEFVMGDEDARAAIIDENKKTVISDKKKKKKKRKSAEVDSTITKSKAERAMTADSEEAEELEPDMSEDKDTESAVADQDTVSTVLDEDKESTFKDLGVVDILCEACERLQWKRPSKIQKEAIPLVLSGQDVVGLAETGSGKTAAFALPIIQALLDKPQRFFAVVLTPTRELAYQISEQFTALGSSIGLKCAVIVGGLDMYDQALMLAKKPHVIVATPGRLVDHLENTKGFNLKTVKFLVMDEADRILSMDFGDELDKIVQVIPKDRRTLMFSATMTRKVQKLQRASLNNPVKVEINSKYKTVDTLVQSYLFVPIKFKDVYLVYVLNELAGNSFMVFCSTCNTVNRLSLMLRNLGFGAIPIYGAMTQDKRLGSLNKFKSQQSSILICTDVASRGLDMPHVDVVINFDIPTHTKDYIHRVGRTARAGRAGKALTFVTQYDIELYKRIEELIKKQLPLYKTEEAEVMQFMERVNEAQRYTKITMKGEEEMRTEKKKRKMTQYGNDSEESSGMRKKFRKKSNKY